MRVVPVDTKNFLQTILSDSGRYCVVGIREGKVIHQKFYTDLDKVVASAARLDMNRINTYFALSTYGDVDARKASNAKYVKALFLDIDCGPDKPYTTKALAIAALKKFCKSVGLPAPTAVVSSGNGIHVYWGLTEAQTRERWTPVANRLKVVCEEHGLHADPTVTSDIARILRVPNTHNFKTDPATTVEILGNVGLLVKFKDFADALGGVVDSNLHRWSHVEAFKETTNNLAGVSYAYKSFKRILQRTRKGKGCAQIGHHISKPNDVSYGGWCDLLSIVKFCQDTNEESVHKVSKGYEHYSREETDKVAASIEVPHTCAKFEENNPGGCTGCRFRGKIKSPIIIGRVVEEATTPTDTVTVIRGDADGDIFSIAAADKAVEVHEIPQYPYPYFRPATGGVYKKVKSKDGEDEDELRVWRNDIYMTKRVLDPREGPSFVIKHHTTRDGVREFVVPSVKLSSKEDFRKAMGMNGIHLIFNDVEPLMRYASEWVHKLQAEQDEVPVRMQFGWTKDEKSFVVGDREILANGIKKNYPSSHTGSLFHIFEKKGSLEEWKKIPDFYNRRNMEEHQFMFGATFGAPCMIFVPAISGAIFHMFSSGSGYGKTTTQLAGASVWGKPKSYILGGSDTINSIWHRTSAYKNMVVYIDEFSNKEPKESSSFAYEVTMGNEKNRMTNNGQNEERYRGEDWKLIVGTTANVSLIERISQYRTVPRGEFQRISEIKASRRFDDPSDVAETLALNRNIEQNYGIAAEPFIQTLLADMDGARNIVLNWLDRIVLVAGLKPENRVWAAQYAATLGGLEIAKSCGLVKFDLENMFNWAVKTLKQQANMSVDMTIDINNIVNEFYEEHQGAILRVSGATGATTVQVPDARPQHGWVMRHEYDVHKLYIRPKPLREWCIKNGYIFSDILSMMETEMNGKRVKMRLGRGTTLDLTPAWTIEISWNEQDQSAYEEEVRSIREFAEDEEDGHEDQEN